MLMKKIMMILVAIIIQFFIGCFPYDDIESFYDLENVEYSLNPEKRVYDLSDSISLTYSFEPNLEKFAEYIFYITVYDNILVHDEFGQNVANKKIHYVPTDTTKIIKTFTLIPQNTGDYSISVGVLGILKKTTSDRYLSSKDFHFSVK